MTTSIYETIKSQLIQLSDNPAFVIANDIDQLTETLAGGYAVDSIFHEDYESANLTELRVWCSEEQLITSMGPLAQFV